MWEVGKPVPGAAGVITGVDTAGVVIRVQSGLTRCEPPGRQDRIEGVGEQAADMHVLSISLVATVPLECH
jgi:hypothetical protein